MIDLNIKKKISIMKMIDLDVEVFIKKTRVTLILKIDDNNIHTKTTLIK